MPKGMTQWRAAQAEEARLWEAYAAAFCDSAPLLQHFGKLCAPLEFAADALDGRRIERALEIGVGPLGIGTLALGLEGRALVGIDPIPRAALRGEDRALSQYVGDLRSRQAYCQATGERLPFKSAVFDLICCHNVIDHCWDPLEILRETWRVLKAGGVFLLSVNTFSALGRLKFETLRRFGPSGTNFVMHPWSFTHSGVRSLTAAQGFHLVREAGRERPWLGASRLSRFLLEKKLQT